MPASFSYVILCLHMLCLLSFYGIRTLHTACLIFSTIARNRSSPTSSTTSQIAIPTQLRRSIVNVCGTADGSKMAEPRSMSGETVARDLSKRPKGSVSEHPFPSLLGGFFWFPFRGDEWFEFQDKKGQCSRRSSNDANKFEVGAGRKWSIN